MHFFTNKCMPFSELDQNQEKLDDYNKNINELEKKIESLKWIDYNVCYLSIIFNFLKFCIF